MNVDNCGINILFVYYVLIYVIKYIWLFIVFKFSVYVIGLVFGIYSMFCFNYVMCDV